MQSFEGVAGDNFNLNLAFTDADGVAIDISDWQSIKCTIKARKSLADDDAGVLQKDATVTDGAGGLAIVSLSSLETADLVGSYFYDIQYIDADDLVKTIMSGVITFTKDITGAGL